MSQLYSSDEEVWWSLACDLCTAVYCTISIHSQPIVGQQGHNTTEGEKDTGRAVCRVFAVVCLLNLSPLHTPQTCARVSTRAEAGSS